MCFLLIICFTNVIECAIILITHASIYLWSKIKLLDNVKIYNAKLFKCYLEDSNILSLISFLTVQHSV